jgi:hypothetical protein
MIITMRKHILITAALQRQHDRWGFFCALAVWAYINKKHQDLNVLKIAKTPLLVRLGGDWIKVNPFYILEPIEGWESVGLA